MGRRATAQAPQAIKVNSPGKDRDEYWQCMLRSTGKKKHQEKASELLLFHLMRAGFPQPFRQASRSCRAVALGLSLPQRSWALALPPRRDDPDAAWPDWSRESLETRYGSEVDQELDRPSFHLPGQPILCIFDPQPRDSMEHCNESWKTSIWSWFAVSASGAGSGHRFGCLVKHAAELIRACACRPASALVD